MEWHERFIVIASSALQASDLKYRLAFCENARKFHEQPGLAMLPEPVAVLSIYEALYSVSRGKQGLDVEYEPPYPGKRKGNPKRADLRVKEPEQGKNWSYIEVKQYDGQGKSKIESDIRKLKSISIRSQRWILAYRVIPKKSRSKRLDELIENNFGSKLEIFQKDDNETITLNGKPGHFDIILSRVK